MNPRRQTNRPAVTGVLMLTSLLAACGLSSCQSSAPTRLYTLTAATPAGARTAYLGPPLQVRAVHVPPELDRIELLRQIAPGQDVVLDYDQWSAPLPRLIRQALSEDLTARLPPGTVLYPNAQPPPAAAAIDVDILAFRIADGVALLDASFSTGTENQVRLQTPVAGNAGPDTSRALSELLGQLADRIAAEIAHAAPKLPPAVLPEHSPPEPARRASTATAPY